ncbi:MAG: hypothetical protein U0821_10000 [Chloroflexota bacterium]
MQPEPLTTAHAKTLVDVYLREQVLRGYVLGERGRVVDTLNAVADELLLQDAQAWSPSSDSAPLSIGDVVVAAEKILVVVPRQAPTSIPSAFRLGWEDGGPLNVKMGVGPFHLTGDLTEALDDPRALTSVRQSRQGDRYLSVGDATVFSVECTGWSTTATVAYVSRESVSFITPTDTRAAAFRPGLSLASISSAAYEGRAGSFSFLG